MPMMGPERLGTEAAGGFGGTKGDVVVEVNSGCAPTLAGEAKEEGKGSVVVEVQLVQGRSWGANSGVGYGHEYGYVKSGVA